MARASERDGLPVTVTRSPGLMVTGPIVHFEPPLRRRAAPIGDAHLDVRVRVDEAEVQHGAVDGHLLAAVVDPGDRVVRTDRDSEHHCKARRDGERR